MPADREDIDPAIESTGDKVHRVVRAGLGLMPVGSGTAVEIFNSLVTPPLEKRKNKWMIEVTESLQALEEKSELNISEVFENEEFLSTLIEASSAALKTHENEKLSALRSAVINSATGDAPEFSKRELYLRYISELTVWHIKLLNLFNDPAEWGARNNVQFPSLYSGGRSHILLKAYPELNNERDFYDQVWKDLYSRGLVNTDSLHGMMTGDGLMQACTTESGQIFIGFITTQEEENV
ncbi:hypothetical protein MNBD_GAMMA26-1412 [hydrothermal vent metagenome]|uniref:Uncharacterized protein n=1 Tax=hydrothermal vent metagenome TaxID=652676 RepID=A0A3B1B9V4_9ZZZZ